MEVPRKVRDVIRDLLDAGFYPIKGGKGSHRKFAHRHFPGAVTISGADGRDAKPYQERQAKRAIERTNDETK